MTSTDESAGERLGLVALLAVLITVPLYFNAASLDSFERDKVALLRSLAPLLLSAVVWHVAGGGKPWRGLNGSGRLAAALVALLLGWQVLATITSIAPNVSLLGDYHRAQGIYTAVAYAIVFAATVMTVRGPRRVTFVIDVMLAAALPIALYGLLQQYGIDPIAWSRQDRSPVLSTMGNEIFSAAYLVLLVPLAMARLAMRLHGVGRVAVAAAGLALFALLAGWWISLEAGIVASGAVLAAAAMLAWRTGLRQVVPTAGLLVLLATLLAAIVFAGSRGPFLGLLSGLGTFGLVVAVARGRRGIALALMGLALVLLAGLVVANLPGTGLAELPVVGRLTQVFSTEGTADVRLRIWRACLALLSQDGPRLLIGHGPDTIRLALQPYYDPGLAPTRANPPWPDRAHNASLDWLITAGLPALATQVALLTILLRRGAGEPGSLVRLAGLVVAAMVGLALVGRAASGDWQFLALSVPGGILLGFAVDLVWPAAAMAVPRPATAITPLSAGLAAALATHLAETAVGIPTASTRLVFWVVCGLLVALPATPTPGWRPAHVWPGVMFLTLLTLGLDFGQGAGANADSFAFAWLVALTLAGLATLMLPAPAGNGWIEQLGYLGVAAFAGLLAARLGLDLVDGNDGRAGTGLVVLVALVVAGTLGLALARGGGFRHWPWAAAVGLLGLGLAWHVDIALVRADEFAKQGWEAVRRRDGAAAVAAYRHATQLAPDEDRYHGLLGAVLLGRAGKAPDRERLLAAAEAEFNRARDLVPNDVEHIANLARFHLMAGGDRHLQAAASGYEAAVARSPGRPELWYEWAGALLRLGHTGAARDALVEALARAPAAAGPRRSLALLDLRNGNCRGATEVVKAGRRYGWRDGEVLAALREYCGNGPGQ